MNTTCTPVAKGLHWLMALLLMLTLASHVLTALWHHFVLKDDAVRRMR